MTGWLKCAVEDGLFSNESLAVFQEISGTRDSIFADNQMIKCNKESCYLIVKIISSDASEARVLLPSESLGGTRWVTVSADMVTSSI